MQAFQLIQTALGTTPPDRRLIVIGDTNSSPNDAPSCLPTPYMLFEEAGFYDIWDLRPGALPGTSGCQLVNLSKG